MKRLLPLFAILLLLTSCSIFRVHKMDIEQGNLMPPDVISQIHTGMSQAQVEDIMGTPLLTNTFSRNRVDYVYTFKAGYGKPQVNSMTLIFRNGRLQSIEHNMYSAFMK